jgi:hypothetical protein
MLMEIALGKPEKARNAEKSIICVWSIQIYVLFTNPA